MARFDPDHGGVHDVWVGNDKRIPFWKDQFYAAVNWDHVFFLQDRLTESGVNELM
jgi:hypothetical protein